MGLNTRAKSSKTKAFTTEFYIEMDTESSNAQRLCTQLNEGKDTPKPSVIERNADVRLGSDDSACSKAATWSSRYATWDTRLAREGRAGCDASLVWDWLTEGDDDVCCS